jgi:hypothetical protein
MIVFVAAIGAGSIVIMVVMVVAVLVFVATEQ